MFSNSCIVSAALCVAFSLHTENTNTGQNIEKEGDYFSIHISKYFCNDKNSSVLVNMGIDKSSR
jgi:hypothetical protein